jgi:hypothetical protein
MPEIDPTNPNVTIERNPRAMASPRPGGSSQFGTVRG